MARLARSEVFDFLITVAIGHFYNRTTRQGGFLMWRERFPSGKTFDHRKSLVIEAVICAN